MIRRAVQGEVGYDSAIGGQGLMTSRVERALWGFMEEYSDG
jgi:hypothetical protein